jgi:NPH3 family
MQFPLLSKSGRIQNLLASATNSANDIHLNDVPGGATSFEICAKFCYGMIVTLNPHNVISTICAAEYLEMHESIVNGNLVYKIDVFLSTSIFRSWKDSIIALQTMKTLKSWCEDLKLVAHCMECIASKASVDVSKVEWSYTYNRKKLAPAVVPKDWWVEDLSEIELDQLKQIIDTIKTKGRVSYQVIGEAVKTYTYKRVPGLSKVSVIQGDAKVKSLVETVTWLLPSEKGSVSCSFLLKLLRAACMLSCGKACKNELVKRVGKQLEEASVNDLLIPTTEGERTIYDIDLVLNIVEEFLMQDTDNGGGKEMERSSVIFCNAKGAVTKLIDGYLAEVAKDPNMPLSKFLDLAEMIPSKSRPVHDGFYRAVDTYLKVLLFLIK